MVQLCEGHEMTAAASSDARWILTAGELRCTVRAQVALLTEEIFEHSSPFYGPEGNQRMRLVATLDDGAGNYLRNVTLWHDACREVTHLDVETAMALGEACERPDGKEKFLEAVNLNAGTKYDFNCSLKTWSDASRTLVRVNANNAELLPDTQGA